MELPKLVRNTLLIYGMPGPVNPVAEHELVAWFWHQQAKLQKNKSRLTVFWLDLYETYWADLYEWQAYELLALLARKTTAKQRKARRQGREERKAKADAEMRKLTKYLSKRRERYKLIKAYMQNTN